MHAHIRQCLKARLGSKGKAMRDPLWRVGEARQRRRVDQPLPESTRMTDDKARLKQQAGEAATAVVESGMVAGLGTGSTAIFATRHIAERLRSGDLKDIVAIATSRATDTAARELGIPMLSDDIPRSIDITIDGADEVDPSLDLIKGGGAALLREKIVAQASQRQVIVVDESKLSPGIGTHWALPVEVLEFGWPDRRSSRSVGHAGRTGGHCRARSVHRHHAGPVRGWPIRGGPCSAGPARGDCRGLCCLFAGPAISGRKAVLRSRTLPRRNWDDRGFRYFVIQLKCTG
jgi:ribose 5-phosphate isomerase